MEKVMQRQLKDINFPVYAIPGGDTYLLEDWRYVDTAEGTKIVHPPLYDGCTILEARLLYKSENHESNIPFAHLKPIFHYTGLFASTAQYIDADGRVFKYTKQTYYPISYAKITEHGQCRTLGFYIQAFGYPCRFTTIVSPEDMPATYAKIVNTTFGPILLTLCDSIGTDKRIKL